MKDHKNLLLLTVFLFAFIQRHKKLKETFYAIMIIVRRRKIMAINEKDILGGKSIILNNNFDIWQYRCWISAEKKTYVKV